MTHILHQAATRLHGIGIQVEQASARWFNLILRRVIKYFWMPGGGVKPDSKVDGINRFILGDSRGGEVAARIDATIGRLPGLAWIDRLTRSRNESLARLIKIEPALSPIVAAD